MTESNALQDWRWMELLGAFSPSPPVHQEALSATTLATLPPGAIDASNQMRVAANPPPSLNDLIWQLDDDDELSPLNMDVDGFCSSFQLEPPLTPWSQREQDAETGGSALLGNLLAPKRKNPLARDVLKKSTCVRRKAEIAMLRDELEKLQQKLVQLRARWTDKPASPSTSEASAYRTLHETTALTTMEPKWKYTAAREREAAKTAEQRNKALKTTLQDQRKMLKAFRKLFKKRAAMMASVKQQFCLALAPNPRLVRTARVSSFYPLLAESASMFEKCDKVQQLVHAQVTEKQEFGWSCAYDDSNDLHLEKVDTFVVPFSRVETESVIRRMYTAQPDATRQIDEYFESSEDTILRQFISSFSNLAGNGDVRVKQTVRRFVDGSKSVFVINKAIERLTARGDSQYRSQSRERTWIMLCNDGDASGSSATTIRVYSTMKLDKMRAAYNALWCEHRLRETVVPVLDQMSARSRGELEALLIEQGKKNRAAVDV